MILGKEHLQNLHWGEHSNWNWNRRFIRTNRNQHKRPLQLTTKNSEQIRSQHLQTKRRQRHPSLAEIIEEKNQGRFNWHNQWLNGVPVMRRHVDITIDTCQPSLYVQHGWYWYGRNDWRKIYLPQTVRIYHLSLKLILLVRHYSLFL